MNIFLIYFYRRARFFFAFRIFFHSGALRIFSAGLESAKSINVGKREFLRWYMLNSLVGWLGALSGIITFRVQAGRQAAAYNLYAMSDEGKRKTHLGTRILSERGAPLGKYQQGTHRHARTYTHTHAGRPLKGRRMQTPWTASLVKAEECRYIALHGNDDYAKSKRRGRRKRERERAPRRRGRNKRKCGSFREWTKSVNIFFLGEVQSPGESKHSGRKKPNICVLELSEENKNWLFKCYKKQIFVRLEFS